MPFMTHVEFFYTCGFATLGRKLQSLLLLIIGLAQSILADHWTPMKCRDCLEFSDINHPATMTLLALKTTKPEVMSEVVNMNPI